MSSISEVVKSKSEEILSPQKLRNLGHSLSKFLRHMKHPAIQTDGYVTLTNLKKHLSENITIEILQHLVANDSKKRYSIKYENGELSVKAHQGHSNHASNLQDDWVLITSSLDIDIVHGTSLKALESILKDGDGLRKMNREWIHFALGIDSNSGIRKNSEVAISLDVQKCLDHGILLYRTGNNIIMSQGQGTTGMIPWEYFSRIIDLRSGLEILF